MSNLSKIVILILIVMTFFFVKEKFGFNFDGFSFKFDGMPKFEFNKDKKKEKEEIVKKPVEIINKDEQKQEKETVDIYFLALDADDNGIYKKVQRDLPAGEDKLEFAIKELLKGPNVIEKAQGAYTEIPKTTKFLSLKQSGSKVIIDFSSDFQYGGGTDSIYSRMMQLIKTSVKNTKKKKIYLYLDGKQVNIIGGEGIMITQPLSEKSLEI